MFEVMERGGSFMWLILAASVVGLAFTIERVYVFWFRFRLNAQQLYNQVVAYLDKGNYSRAIEVCGIAAKHPVAQVLKAGLMSANKPDAEIERAMDAAALKAAPKVTRHIAYLAVIANIATLLGLLGTILGLIVTFEGVGQADAAMKQEILSKGIGVAMFTTAAGLIAAIPNMVAHAILQSKQNAILNDMQTLGTELFNYLSAESKDGDKLTERAS